MKRTLGLLALCAVGFAGSQASSCMEYDEGLEGEIPLTTEVADWREEVIYQVLVDRFADGDPSNNYNVDRSAPARYHGGDWKGLEDNLGYLQELGVTTLWISPIVKNVETDAGVDGYHGYWAQDLTKLNPHFGDLAALRSLVNAAHERDMKIIVDIVTNHLGQLFYYDINLNGQPDERVEGDGKTSPVLHINEYDPDFDPRGIQAFTSLGEAGPAPVIFLRDPASNHMPPFPEVFQNPLAYNRKGRTYNFDDPDQLLTGDFPGGLKDVNTKLCQKRDGIGVKDAMVESYARWVELTNIDGFRIDTVKHVEGEFWRFFTQKVRQRLAAKGKDKFLMFGEAFDGNDVLVGSFTKNDLPPEEALASENACVTDGKSITGDQLDSVFYFPQYFTAIRDVFQLNLETSRIEALWASRVDNYGQAAAENGIGVSPQKVLINFLDNHDVPRFLFSGAGPDALHNALLFVFTEQGIPCLYYGTEQRFDGGNDPANREDLWDTGFDTQAPTFQFIRRITRIRQTYPALVYGDQFVTWSSDRIADEEDAGIFSFERTGGDAGDAYALLIFNTSRTKASAPQFEGTAMMVSAAPGTVLVDVLSGGDISVTVADDGTVSLASPIPAMNALLLVPEGQFKSGL